MAAESARGRHVGAIAVVCLLLSGCAGHLFHSGAGGGDSDLNAYPANYKSDILAAMHAYLNDPTGIRAGAVSAPMLKSVAGNTHYVACLRFSAKESNGAYAPVKEIAAVFLVGRFDDFVDGAPARETCAGVTYEPFPELGNLQR
jgi:hypothetical protein